MPKLVNSSSFIVNGFKKNSNRLPTTNHQPRTNHGFTLIELLVVIAIIGILAALATVSYTDSQKKSRDSRRKSDLSAIQKALELAKQDSAGNYSYPICTPYASAAPLPTNACYAGDSTISQGSTTLATTYIKKVPLDPKTGTGYVYYTYTSDGSTSCITASTCVTFKLVACLENTKDPQKDPNSPSGAATNTTVCGALATTGLVSYTISNL